MITLTEKINETPFLNLFKRTYGADKTWYVASRREEPLNLTEKDDQTADAVVIIGRMVDQDVERFVFVKQFRPPIGADIYELPAGLIDEGESPENAAVREMKEETGLEFTPTAKLPRMFVSPGITDECFIIVMGEVSGNISKEFQEKNEDIEIFLLTKDDIETMILQGHPVDAKTFAIGYGFVYGKLEQK